MFIREKKLNNTNLFASRHIKREKASLPVDVRRSKMSLLKLPIVRTVKPVDCTGFTSNCVSIFMIVIKSVFFWLSSLLLKTSLLWGVIRPWMRDFQE